MYAYMSVSQLIALSWATFGDMRCIRALGFFPTEMDFTEKHLPLSVAICDRNHANRIPRRKVGVGLVV